MKPSDHRKESFGTLPNDAERAQNGANGVLIPHLGSDVSDLERVRDLLFGSASRAQSERTAALESETS